jgi:hypothetical protein
MIGNACLKYLPPTLGHGLFEDAGGKLNYVSRPPLFFWPKFAAENILLRGLGTGGIHSRGGQAPTFAITHLLAHLAIDEIYNFLV